MKLNLIILIGLLLAGSGCYDDPVAPVEPEKKYEYNYWTFKNTGPDAVIRRVTYVLHLPEGPYVRELDYTIAPGDTVSIKIEKGKTDKAYFFSKQGCSTVQRYMNWYYQDEYKLCYGTIKDDMTFSLW